MYLCYLHKICEICYIKNMLLHKNLHYNNELYKWQKNKIL